MSEVPKEYSTPNNDKIVEDYYTYLRELFGGTEIGRFQFELFTTRLCSVGTETFWRLVKVFKVITAPDSTEEDFSAIIAEIAQYIDEFEPKQAPYEPQIAVDKEIADVESHVQNTVTTTAPLS